jgi:formate dehydrogenase subunit gamma
MEVINRENVLVGESVIEVAEAEKVAQIKRFEVQQIIQHATLMLSFTVLVITGLPMKFNTWGISEWWMATWGGIGVIRSVHHIAAYVMVALCVYHLVYLGYSILVQKKPFPTAMLPSLQDFVKFSQEIRYFFGLRKSPPQYDRFNWREKFDYWAIFWGIPVMAGSGFILLFPVIATKVLPGWVVPVALTAHSHEAVLALGWIFLVHVFFNHFTPGLFPLNKSIFTGRVPEVRYQREHPLEYVRIQRQKAQSIKRYEPILNTTNNTNTTNTTNIPIGDNE